MPDITMCSNNYCPKKKKCYRYMAVPNMWQSYCKFDYRGACDYFIALKDNKNDNRQDRQDNTK